MDHLQTLLDSLVGRALCLGLALLVLALGCQAPGVPPLAPADGMPDYQRPAAIVVPGGVVNAAGGNLMIERVDLSLDTILGTQELGASYNAASGDWLWGFDVHYDGSLFRDPTGASHDVTAVADGAAIPGSVWVKVDARKIKSKGGLLHEFDAGGHLLSLRWTSNAFPVLWYDAAFVAGAQRVVEIRQCPIPDECSSLFQIERDAEGRVQAIDDRAGRRAEFEWDAGGRLVGARDALDVERGWTGFRYEYDGALLTAQINSEGERIEYAYDADGRVVRVRQVGEENPTHDLSYHPPLGFGLPYQTVHLDPLGAGHLYLYDGERRLRQSRSLEGPEFVRRAWQARRAIRIERPGGEVTQRSYQDDDLVQEIQPSGNVVQYFWEPDAENRARPFERAPARVEDSLGVLAVWAYDPQGRLVALANGEGETALFSYHPFGICLGSGCPTPETRGALARITRPDGSWLELHDYGVHGHPTRVEHSNATFETRSWDGVGNPVDAGVGAGEWGGVQARHYDGDRNLVALDLTSLDAEGTAAAAGALTIERRSDGRRSAIRRPGGGDHEFVYDAIGRVVESRERADGQWHSTWIERDAAGRASAVERPNGMREEYGYDAAGRVTRRAALRHGQLEGEAWFGYAGRRLVTIQDSTRGGTERYVHDAAGRVSEIQFVQGERLTFAYDARSRPISEQYHFPAPETAHEVTYSYDLAGRALEIRADGVVLLEHQYQSGWRSLTRYGNGLERSYQRDPGNGALLGTTTVDGAGLAVEDTTLARALLDDPARWEIAALTSMAGGVSVEERHWLGPFGDPVGQPESAAGKRIFGWSDGVAGRGFAHDALSNRAGSGGDVFVYNGESNRLQWAQPDAGAGIAYAYDEAGFVTARGGESLAWTATGRIAAIGSDSFSWDMLDRPLAWNVGGVESDWSWFGGRVDASGQSDRTEVKIDFVSGEHLYRHMDFRGNVQFTSDSTGQVELHYRYSPYAVDAVFGSGGDPMSFAARPRLGELSLLGARIYDGAVGRFLSPDPLLQPVNQYAYTLGNPVWFWDPDGRDAVTTVEVAAGSVVFVVGTALAVTAAPATAVAAVLTAVGVGIGGLAFALLVARAINQKHAFIRAGAPVPGAITPRALPVASGGSGPSPSGGSPGGGLGSEDGGGPGIAGGGGGHGACGLLGIEPLLLCWGMLAFRRRRGSRHA